MRDSASSSSGNELGVWLQATVNECFQQAPDGRLALEMSSLTARVRREPTRACEAIAMLAWEISRALGGRPVTEASGIQATNRLLLGGLCSAHFVYASSDLGLPAGTPAPDLRPLLERYPLIIESVNLLAGQYSG